MSQALIWICHLIETSQRNEWERWSSLTRSEHWDREAQRQGQAEQMHSYSDIMAIVPAHQESSAGLSKNLPRANWPSAELLDCLRTPYVLWYSNVGLSILSCIGRENVLLKIMTPGWLPLKHKISCLDLTFSLVSLRTPWFAVCVIWQRTDMTLVLWWKNSWIPHVMLWGTTGELGCPYIVNLIEEQMLKEELLFQGCLQALRALDVYWIYNWWHPQPYAVTFVRETEKLVRYYGVLLHEACEQLYILSKTAASVLRMKYFSIIYSRKSTQNYDYEATICEKLCNHTYFLEGKLLPLQISGKKKTNVR